MCTREARNSPYASLLLKVAVWAVLQEQLRHGQDTHNAKVAYVT
jgi:hypothetical protein